MLREQQEWLGVSGDGKAVEDLTGRIPAVGVEDSAGESEGRMQAPEGWGGRHEYDTESKRSLSGCLEIWRVVREPHEGTTEDGGSFDEDTLQED